MLTLFYGSDLGSWLWWKLTFEFAGRQALQALAPFAALAAVTTGLLGVDWLTVAVLGALAAVTSIGRRMMGLAVHAGAPLWARLMDRSVAAFGGAFVGLVGADHFTALTADWLHILDLSLASAVLSLVMSAVMPPSITDTGSDAGQVAGTV